MTDSELIEELVMSFWPVLGGNHQEPEVWEGISSIVRETVIPIIKREREAERAAIVAWLRESLSMEQDASWIATAIEAGEHHA